MEEKGIMLIKESQMVGKPANQIEKTNTCTE